MAGNSTNGKLMDFMFEQLGGKEAVRKQYVKDRLLAAVGGGSTIGQIMEKAEEEGWLDSLKALKFSDLMGASKAAPRKVGKRITQAEKESIQAAVLATVKKQPWIGSIEIVQIVGGDPGRVKSQISALKRDGQLKASGAKAAMVYAVKGEKKKHVAATAG